MTNEVFNRRCGIRGKASLLYLTCMMSLSWCLPILGQFDLPELGNEYQFKRWSIDDGLPQSTVTSIAQTRDGYIWIGTFNGLVRFDGVEFKIFDATTTPELPHEGVVNLHVDQLGRFWVSTLRGLAVLDGGEWRTISSGPISESLFARSLFSHGDKLYMTSWNGKVFVFEKNRLVELPDRPGPTGGCIGHVDDDGTVWVGRQGFFGHWDGSRWVSSPLAATVAQEFNGMGTSRDGSLFLSHGNLLSKISGGQILSQVTLAENPGMCWKIYEDSVGIVWLCSDGSGAIGVDALGVVKGFILPDSYMKRTIRSMTEDSEHNLWVGTIGDGLLRLREKRFHEVDLSAFSQNSSVTSLFPDGEGRMLLGSYGRGSMVVEGGHVRRPVIAEGSIAPRYVQSQLKDAEGRIWIGAYGEGLNVLRENGQIDRIEEAKSEGKNVSALFLDSQGRMWVGDNRTISVVIDEDPRPFSDAGDTLLGGVRCFAEDPATGTIWAASETGLFRYEAGSWSEIKDSRGDSIERIYCMLAEPDGGLWIGGTGHALRRLRNGRLISIAETNGFPAKKVFSMIDDGFGYWWFGSNQGVLRVLKKELDQVVDGRKERLLCQVFTQSDGLPSLECVGGYQSTVAQGSDGRLWFPTIRGLVTIDPQGILTNTNPPPVVIERFRIETSNKEQQIVEVPGSGPITVPPGRYSELSVLFSVLSYTDPESVRAAYMIEGFHSDWIDLDGKRSLYAHPPPPGHYRLRIKASNSHGAWNEDSASLLFTLQPFFWQTWWFRVFALGGLFGGASTVSWRASRTKWRRRIEQLEQKKILDAERARLATVLESTNDLVAFTDKEGRVLFINSSGRKMLGLEADESVIGRHLADFSATWTSDVSKNEAFTTAIRDGSWNGETALRHSSGREIPVLQTIMAHRKEDAIVDFVSTIARDITETKRIAEALQRKTHQLQERVKELNCLYEISELIENSGGSLDRICQGTITAVPGSWQFPECACARISVEGNVFETKNFQETAWKQEALIKKYRQVIGAVEVYYLDEKPEAEEGPFLKEERLLIDAIAERLGHTIERLHGEADLKDYHEKMFRTEQLASLGTMGSTLAHRLNQPLTVIRMSVQKSLRDLHHAGCSEMAKELLNDSLDQVGRASSIVGEFLALGRISPNEKKTTVNIDTTARKTTSVLEEMASRRSVKLVVEDSLKTLPNIECTSGEFDQVCFILIENAIQAATPDKKQWLRIDGHRAEDYIELTFSDNCGGIEPDKLDRIFEPFFTTKSTEKGTGLGLTILQQIVSNHHGNVRVESDFGRGTSFYVTLPSIE